MRNIEWIKSVEKEIIGELSNEEIKEIISSFKKELKNRKVD